MMTGAIRDTSTSSSEKPSNGKKPSTRGKKDAEIASDVISRFEEPTWAKAYRLLVEGSVRVTFVAAGSIQAVVKGDHGEYYVDFGLTRKERWTCSCPARVDCSHMRAVALVTK